MVDTPCKNQKSIARLLVLPILIKSHASSKAPGLCSYLKIYLAYASNLTYGNRKRLLNVIVIIIQ